MDAMRLAIVPDEISTVAITEQYSSNSLVSTHIRLYEPPLANSKRALNLILIAQCKLVDQILCG